MKDTTEGIKIRLGGREYSVVCADDEREDLLAAADYLSQQMQKVQRTGKVLSPERCAVMTALNMAYDLNQLQKQQGQSTLTGERLEQIQNKIDHALHQQSSLEFS